MTAPLAVVCGGILMDSVVTAEGAINEGALGGNAVYAAAGLRLWLGPDRVGIVGHVPATFPEALLDRLRRAGIRTEGVHRSAMRVRGPEWFVYAPDGSRRDELSAPSDGDANPDFPTFRRAHPVRLAHVPPAWRAPSGLHLAGNDPDALLELARAMPEARITLDPGARAQDLARHPDRDRVLSLVTAAIPSLKELAVLAPGLEVEAALTALQDRGAPMVLVKCGSQGVLLRDALGRLTAIPALSVAAPDPTGAGDSFCGGFLAGLMLSRGPVTAACMGTVAASFAVAGFGPDALLEATESLRDQRLAELSARLGQTPTLLTGTSLS